MLSAVLDSCFVLSRTSLIISDTSTYATAYNYLAKGASLLPAMPAADSVLTHANLLRCISGAYHNIAATLCQASRYDFAIRFLDRSCALGAKALSMYRENVKIIDGPTGHSEEAWAQLEEQVYRRWEILGVCHSKLADRKVKQYVSPMSTRKLRFVLASWSSPRSVTASSPSHSTDTTSTDWHRNADLYHCGIVLN